MKDFFRAYESVLDARLKEAQPLIQALIGPRQVGKTTCLRRLEKQGATYYSADSPTPLPPEMIEQWWQEAASGPKKILLIDEVQKISGWSEVLKKLWDRQKENTHPIKVVISGSAALSIEKGLRESLAGRFELLRATHWGYRESAEVFNMPLSKFVEFGCYPGSQIFFDDVERWAAYVRDAIVEPVIGRDLLQLHPVEKPALLRQIFGVALAQPAQTISLQKIQGQLHEKGAIATIQHYLELLSGAFLLTGVEKYAASEFRSKKSSPKLVVHENSLVRASRRPVNGELSSEELGRYFENSVLSRFIESGWETYYWSERNFEVDAIVLGPEGEKWAVEVKSAETDRKGLNGLFEFVKRYNEFEPKLVSLIDQRIDGVETLPVIEILSLQPDGHSVKGRKQRMSEMLGTGFFSGDLRKMRGSKAKE